MLEMVLCEKSMIKIEFITNYFICSAVEWEKIKFGLRRVRESVRLLISLINMCAMVQGIHRVNLITILASRTGTSFIFRLHFMSSPSSLTNFHPELS